MSKKKLLLSIPLLIAAGYLIYTLIMFASGEISLVWKHYLGIILFPIPIYVFFKSLYKAVIVSGIYLLIGTFGLFSITPDIETVIYRLRLGDLHISTPLLDPLFLKLFILFIVLNGFTLADMYILYKERKQAKD